VLGHGRALGAVDTDRVEGAVMPPSGVSALVAGAEGLGLSATDGGLSPPPPSSVEPSGIPTGPTGQPGEANGGDADAPQVPSALAVIQPPSNGALPDSPGVALAVPAPAIPTDAPVIGLAVVVELPMAADAGRFPARSISCSPMPKAVVGGVAARDGDAHRTNSKMLQKLPS
jgi:hypothetical protein